MSNELVLQNIEIGKFVVCGYFQEKRKPKSERTNKTVDLAISKLKEGSSVLFVLFDLKLDEAVNRFNAKGMADAETTLFEKLELIIALKEYSLKALTEIIEKATEHKNFDIILVDHLLEFVFEKRGV